MPRRASGSPTRAPLKKSPFQSPASHKAKRRTPQRATPKPATAAKPVDAAASSSSPPLAKNEFGRTGSTFTVVAVEEGRLQLFSLLRFPRMSRPLLFVCLLLPMYLFLVGSGVIEETLSGPNTQLQFKPTVQALLKRGTDCPASGSWCSCATVASWTCIFRMENNFVMTLFQMLTMSSICALVRLLNGQSLAPRVATRGAWVDLFFVSVLQTSSVLAANVANSYMSYPTKVIFKSMRMIPLMIVGVLLFEKTYRPPELFSAAVLCFGLYTMSTADALVAAEQRGAAAAGDAGAGDTPFGLYLMVFSALCDSFFPEVQNHAIKKVGLSKSDVLLYSTAGGSVYVAMLISFSSLAFGTPGLPTILGVVTALPASELGYLLAFGSANFMGSSFVLTIIGAFGVFALQVSLATRQFLTVLVSYMFVGEREFTLPGRFVDAGHPFTSHAAATALVVGAISTQILYSNRIWPFATPRAKAE